MTIFKGLKVGHPWQVRNRGPLTPWEYLQVVSATVVQSQFGYSVEFLLKNGGKSRIPLTAKCCKDQIEGTTIDPLNIEILTLEKDGNIVYRIEF